MEGCTGFDWDDANAQKNWVRHHVTPEKAEDLFFHRHQGVQPRRLPVEVVGDGALRPNRWNWDFKVGDNVDSKPRLRVYAP